jgi:uncharacterized protein (TIGR02594 family)
VTVTATRSNNKPLCEGPEHHSPTPIARVTSPGVQSRDAPGPEETSTSAASHSLTAKYKKPSVLENGAVPAGDAGAPAPTGTRHQPLVVGTQPTEGVPVTPGETFRNLAESGKYTEAARMMNGLSMSDMLVYCDRLSPATREALAKSLPTVNGIDTTRLQFAMDVVGNRQLPLVTSGLPSDQLSDAANFLRSRDWMDRAHAEVRTVEKKGAEDRYPEDHPNKDQRGQLVDTNLPRSNPRIVEYHVAGGLGRAPDEQPWCSSYANFVMKDAGETASGRPSAQSWLKWGKELDRPAVGSIAVIKGSRGDGADEKGHVGFVAGVTPDGRPVLLGGNQDDEVNYAIEQRPVYSYRVPSDYSPPPADFQLPILEGAHQKKSDR